MKLTFGIVCFVVTILAVTVNAILMLISPEVWFRLPRWIRFSGSLRAAKFRKGVGAIQVRILGGCLLGIVVWFLHSWVVR